MHIELICIYLHANVKCFQHNYYCIIILLLLLLYTVLDTFSIQSITLTDIIGPVIVVVCTFRPNTVAVLCLIQLILLTDNTVQYTNTSNRTGDQAIIILSGVTTGSYQLRVFEVESDQSLVPVSHLETIIESATITTLIMSSTITTSLTDSSNTITSTSSISVNGKNYHYY